MPSSTPMTTIGSRCAFPSRASVTSKSALTIRNAPGRLFQNILITSRESRKRFESREFLHHDIRPVLRSQPDGPASGQNERVAVQFLIEMVRRSDVVHGSRPYPYCPERARVLRMAGCVLRMSGM
jgi:hypothetical protein